MAVWTKEAEVPSEFPPARLFLDDIEEIVRILVRANQRQDTAGGVLRPKVTFRIKDQECDSVQELPKIAKKTINLLITIERESWSQTYLKFSRYGTSLDFFAVTREEKLSIFHDLAPIFKRRNLWLATLVRRERTLILSLIVLVTLANIALLTLGLKKQIPTLVPLFTTAMAITFLATTWHHSVIIMRNSSEPSPLRQGLPQKIILLAVGGIVTFFFTVLGFYLKHKYWP